MTLVRRLTLPFFLATAAFALLSYPLALSVGWGGLRHGYWTYNAGPASISWLDTGFARRELEGTLIRLFTADPMVGAAGFHVVTFSLLAAFGIWACCQTRLSIERRVAVSAVFLAILARLATDVGRTDAAVMVCGLLAAWSALEARWAICAGALSVALLFHETGLIVLAPLVGVAAIASGPSRAWQTRSALVGAGIMLCALTAYALSFRVQADLPALVGRLHRQMLEPEHAEMTISANFGAAKGLAASICANRANPIYPLRVACGLALCPALAFGLQRERVGMAILVAAPSFLFLSAIASDVGRWATMAAFCIFAMGALLPEQRRPLSLLAAVIATLAAAALAACLRLSDVGPVFPLIDYAAQSSGVQNVDWGKAYPDCNPEWRRDLVRHRT